MQSDLPAQKLSVVGDIPPPRFGHSLTMVSKTKAILFGGAIGDSGKFAITNEVYSFEFPTNKWKKLDVKGQPPTQRAAHAAAQIDTNQMVVYGGAASGGGGLSNDDLFLLDLRNTETWIIIPVTGPTPGKRYGHTMVFFKPFLIVFGGNTGTTAVNDVWVLNVDKAPYSWQNYQCEGSEQPCVRVYHSANLCQTGSANGMMVIFGGRTSDQSALNDCWGLRKHRDGRWDWVLAPYKQNGEMPICRYQHWISFIGPLMIVTGGRTNASEEQSQQLEIYDTESSDWYKVNSINRYRHSIVQMDHILYMHGGFEPEFPNKPLDSLLSLDMSKIGQIFPKLQKNFGNKESQNILQESIRSNRPGSAQTNFLNTSNQNIGNDLNQQTPNNQQKPLINKINTNVNSSTSNTNIIQQTNQNNSNNTRSITPIKQNNNTNNTTFLSYKNNNNNQKNKNIRISNQAIVATSYTPDDQNTNVIKKVPIQQLAEESKKLGIGYQDQMFFSSQNNLDPFCQLFLNTLLKPRDWKQNDYRIPFKKELIMRLCDEVIRILHQQPSILRLRVPLKIFGSLHGRFNELLRYFENFGSPYEDEQNSDIENFDYLFLGNYVDRGFNSLELVITLFALKVKYPEQVHLLRGKHEDIKMNKLQGFAEECSNRLGEDINDPQSVFQTINRVFELLPLAALLEDKVLCVNGGLGKNITSIEQIEDIQRPLNIWDSYGQNYLELLWSEYSSTILPNSESGVVDNVAKDIFQTGLITKYDESKLQTFLQQNNLTMLINSHSCIQEGFERTQNGSQLTIFSSPDYGGKFQNIGAMIKIKKNFEVIPCLLIPSTTKQGQWINSEINLKTNIVFSEDEKLYRKKQNQFTPPKNYKTLNSQNPLQINSVQLNQQIKML